jgi:hypothetical protein
MTVIAPALALVLGSAALVTPTAAAAASEEKELKLPAPPSEATERRRAEMWAALAPELHAPLRSAVVETKKRMRTDHKDLAVREAARAALVAIDFAGGSKKAVDAATDLVVLELAVSLHGDLRVAIDRQLAMRAVLKCKGNAECLDAIAPTDVMSQATITAVRTEYAGQLDVLASESRRGNFEIQDLMATINQTESDRPPKAPEAPPPKKPKK